MTMKHNAFIILVLLACHFSLRGQDAALSHETYDLSKHYPSKGLNNEPVYLRESPMNEATVQVFEDGTIKVYHAPNRYSDSVMSMKSTDGGFTWSESEVIYQDSIIWQYPRRTLIDEDGNIHLLVFREPDLSVFHTMYHSGSQEWTALKKIADGRIGAIRGFIQTESGRLIFGFHRHIWENKPPNGGCFCASVWSDDNGKTWQESTSRVVAPVFEDYIGSNYGAVEPNLVQLGNGNILMLIRTQNGWLYQSVSEDDGETWSEGVPSIFHTSNSPANLLKLPDGRIAITWCNTGDPHINTFGRIYTNRDVLHMAISDDDGRSWKGFREVFRVPTRNDQNNIKRSDSGSSYPNTAYTGEKKIILVTGQGEEAGGRAMFLISPEWLYENSMEDDFSGGLEKWSCYTLSDLTLLPGRNMGPELMSDPDAAGGKVLHIRKAFPDLFGDGAVRNFPMGRKGEMKIRLKILPGSQGTAISLTDHHRHPNDPDGDKTAMFNLDSESIPGNDWQILTLKWDLDSESCKVLLDDKLLTDMKLSSESRSGISYLRFRSLAEEGTRDDAGLMVDWVKVKTE
ncbi:MAG TPA: exo-alpha-sialidase [Bacteroides sp.]|nr:exo-alpha-sialidase [Bacteroides sp.]